MMRVYTIVKKDPTDRTEKGFWHNIGVAFVNKDGSINVKLAAFPANGELHIREEVKKEEDFG